RDLNAALAQAAAEQRRRAELEEAERKRLEAEKKDLEKYRSEFFGRLRDLMSDRDGVNVVGDRFVFSSEVLFAPGEARLSAEGQTEIAKVARLIEEIAAAIPQGIDWILQVDGHTDDVPLIPSAQFADNWELSQARALSVVRYMSDVLGLPPERLSANGFGQYQPLAEGDSPEARAQNRRIELKLTER
ncbi:MAG: OmpA family protein, partial [Pseudooceanicola nanhaiensis]